MSIPTIYIKGTKKQANEAIARGDRLYGDEFTMSIVHRRELKCMPDGTVIKFYDRFVDGNPVAKAYGNWRPAKNKIV